MNAKVEFDLDALTAEFKQATKDLYGSCAQGDFHAESDVDLMVVLRGDLNREDEGIQVEDDSETRT